MSSAQREAAQKEADRILNAIFERTSKWPKPTGMSVYNPKSSDVIVSTFPKAGTTLLQNMVYQIVVSTGGAPSFDPDGTNFRDISEVAPWLDYGPQFGILECKSDPRVFKTHSKVTVFDLTKATYIYCIRDPEKFPASWLNFLVDALSEESITDPILQEALFHTNVRRRLLGFTDSGSTLPEGSPYTTPKESRADSLTPGPWFQHVKGWTEVPRENVLILFYEDVVSDLRGTALCVASFMKRSLSAEALETVVSRCERKAMFGDPRFNCGVEGRGFGFSSSAQKVKDIDTKGYSRFKLREEDKNIVSQMMHEALGVETYAELRKSLRKRQQEHFPSIAYQVHDDKSTV